MPCSIRHAAAVGASVLLASGAAFAFNPQPDPPDKGIEHRESPWRIAQRATAQSQKGIIILDKPGTKGLGGPDTKAFNPSKGSVKGFHEVDEKSKRKAGATIEEKSKSKGNWKAIHDVEEKSKKPK